MQLSRKTLKRLTFGAVLAAVTWLLCSYAVAYRLTRRPLARCDEPVPEVTWGRIESLRLSTVDGEQIGGWFIDGRPDQPVVLLLHGNGASRSACLPQAEMAGLVGCSVLMISLRAHGDSTGELNDFGYSARQDVLAAIDWLEHNHPGRPVVVWGQSLGAAAAVFAAEEIGERVCGYILECTYRDLRTAVWNCTRRYLPPVLNVIAYAGLLTVKPLVLADGDRLSPIDAITGVPPSVPVLFLAGGADTRARPEESKALAERIRSHARLLTIADAEHLQLADADPATYRAAVLDFVASCRSK